MFPTRSLLLCLFPLGSLVAQRTVTVPRGFDSVESISTPVSAGHPFFAANARWQVLDGSLRGNVINGIQKLELRRDGDTATGSFPARTTKLQVLFSHGNAATYSTQFAGNYVGAPATMFAKQAINLPDLSAATPTPAPWGIAIPFDSGKTFNYDGAHELLVEFQCEATTPVDKLWPLEAVDSTGPGVGQVGFLEQFGYCTTPNGSFLIFPRAPETSAGVVKLTCMGRGAPNNAPGALGIGFSDLALGNVFCAKLRTSAELLLPVTALATGEIGSSAQPISLQGPYSGDATLFLQFVALDPSQQPKPGVALSDAAKVRIVSGTAAVAMQRLYVTSGSLPPSSLPTGQRSTLLGLVMRLTYP